MRRSFLIGTLAAAIAAFVLGVSGDGHPAYANAFVVDTTADTVDATPGDGVCTDAAGDCSLRAAVMEANALGGAHTIALAATTYTIAIPPTDTAVNEATGDLDIRTNITMTGVTRETTIIDGDGVSRVRRLGSKRNLDNSIASYGRLFLEHLTVTGGTQVDPDGVDIFGGGIRALFIDPLEWQHGVTQLSLDDVVVSNNSAPSGGGIANNIKTEIADSLIVGNAGELSGGGSSVVRARISRSYGLRSSTIR